MCFTALFSSGRWEMQGRAHKGFFLRSCWVLHAGGLLEFQLPLSWHFPGSSFFWGPGWGVELLLFPATGAHCAGIKGFVLVGKLRHEERTGACQQAERSPSNTAFCPLGCAAPRMAWMGVDFPFKCDSPVGRDERHTHRVFLHRSCVQPGASAPLLVGRDG